MIVCTPISWSGKAQGQPWEARVGKESTAEEHGPHIMELRRSRMIEAF